MSFALKRRPIEDGYRRSWRYPPIVEAKIREWIRGFSLHVCSGRSSLGNVKLDLYEYSDVMGDMTKLPFRDELFDTVIWDPPYRLSRVMFHRALQEIWRVTKKLGRIITLLIKDPTLYLQRKMRLIWKAYYEPKTLGSVRVLVVAEKLPFKRPKLGRRDHLVPAPVDLFEPQITLVSTGVGGMNE